MTTIEELLQRQQRLQSIVYNLIQVAVNVRNEYPDDARAFQIYIDKYESAREENSKRISEIQLNCKHQWGFHGYGSGDRLMRCSKCLAIRQEAST